MSYCSKNRKWINVCIIITSFFLISFIGSIILFKSHIIVNVVDSQFHIKRISELSDDIYHLNFLPFFSFNQFNGSAVMGLYPYINLVPIIILSRIIESKITLFYFYFAFQLFMGLIICYFSSLHFSHYDKYTSYLFSIIYMMSNVFLSYNFGIMDFGASSAFIFFPLILFGFFDILNNSKDYIKLALGLTLITYSHIPSTLISIFLLVILFFINIKLINKKKFINYIKAIIVFILLTSIVWLPASLFLIRNSAIIHFINPVNPVGISWRDFIASGIGKININGLGFFASISVILSLFFYIKFNRYIKQMYIISIIIIIICKWPIMPSIFIQILSHFQFMYRFLLIPIIMLDYIFSLIITKFFNFKMHKREIFIICILLSVSLQMLGQRSIIRAGEYTPTQTLNNHLNYNIHTSKQMNFITNLKPYGTNKNNRVTDKTTGSDYFPKDSFPKINKIDKYVDNNNSKLNNIGYNKFKFYLKNQSHKTILPFVLYNNEKLKLRINNRSYVYYPDKCRLIVVNNLPKGENILTIKYVQNIRIIICELILFILGLLASLYQFIINMRLKNKSVM